MVTDTLDSLIIKLLLHVKDLEQCLTQKNCLKNISYYHALKTVKEFLVSMSWYDQVDIHTYLLV